MTEKMIRALLALMGAVILVTQVAAEPWTSNNFFYKPSLGARGAEEKAKFDSGLDRVDARLGNEKWLNDTAYGGNLQTAIATIGSTRTILSIPSGTWSISADTIVPANIALKLTQGAVLSIGNAVTLTINGPLEAGLHQIFSWAGTGKVVFGKGVVKEVYPHWWGAKGDGLVDDAATINAANTAIEPGGTVFFPAGAYLTGSQLIKSSSTRWIGAKNSSQVSVDGGVILQLGYNGTLIEINASPLYGEYGGIQDISLQGNGSYANGVGISFTGNTRQTVLRNMFIGGFKYGLSGYPGELYGERLFVTNCKYPLYGAYGDCQFFQCLFGGGTMTGTVFAGGNAAYLAANRNTWFTDCIFQVQKSGGGAKFINSSVVRFANCSFEGNEGDGLYLQNCWDIWLTNCISYNNGTVAANASGIVLYTDYQTFTADPGTDLITLPTSFGLQTKQPIQFTSGGTLPAPLQADTTYYAIYVSDTTYRLATSYSKAAANNYINITDAGSGTHTLRFITKDIVIQGGAIYDEDWLDATYRKQYNGINIQNSGVMNNIVINGVDLAKSYNAITVTTVLPIKDIRIVNCPGFGDMKNDNGDASVTMNLKAESVQRWNTALTADRNCTLPTSRIYDGRIIRIIRDAGATGAFNLLVKDGATTLKTHNAAGQWSEYSYSAASGAWRLIAAGTL